MKKNLIIALILMLTPFIVAGEVSAATINSDSTNKTLKSDLKVTKVVVHGSVVRSCNMAVTIQSPT